MRHDSFTSTFSVRNVLVTTAILASMSLAAGAFAQAPPPGVPPATPPANPNQRPPLGGPQVDPGAADSEKGFNGGKQGGKKGRAESGVMMDERMKDVGWMRTYESMKPTLSADTLNKTEAIKAVYEVAMKTWNDANADKMKSLREQMKGQKGQKDQKDQKDQQAAAEQMKALRDTMPKMEETQKQIFALLSESEQATFKTKLEANEKQMRSLRSRDGSADAGGNADGKGKGGKGKGGKGAQGGQGGRPGEGQPSEGGSDNSPPPLPPLPPPPFDP